MTYSDVVVQEAVELLVYMGFLGVAAGAFVVLATAGLCSVLHLFKKIAEGRG